MTQSPSRFRLLAALLILAAGCQSAPPTTPTPSGSPTAAPAVPAPSAPATVPPTASPTSPPTATVVTEGAVTRFDASAGQTASGTTPPGRQVTLALSAATDQASSVELRLSGAGHTAGSTYRTASTAGLAISPDVGDAAAAALRAPRSTGRRVLQAASRTVGSTETFWINTGGFTPEGDRQQTAVLRRVTPHAYVYVDRDAQAIADADLDRLATAFEGTIYPKVTGVFGQEARPGVDGDDRLFIVLSPAVHDFDRNTDLLGYFWAPDAIPNPAPGSHSNQKEVLFMSDRLPTAASLLAYGTLAHEFQHLINFTRKGPRLNYGANEATWLDEGLSMLAMDVAGYGLSAGEQLVATNIRAFENDSGAYTLQDWAANPDGYAFGQSYLFVRYLVDRYGEEIIPALLSSSKRGAEAIDEVLAPRGSSFARLFQDWAIANVLSDAPLSAGTPYRYNSLRLNGTYGSVTLPGFQLKSPANAVTLRPWSTVYYRTRAPEAQPWSFEVAPSSGRAVGAAIAGP